MASSPTPTAKVPEAPALRVDRWLHAARIYHSRTHAADACNGGHVRVNGATVKPSHPVKIGDEITARAPRGPVVLLVSKLSERRLSPALARELYEDRSPPPPPRDEFAPLAMREAGAGRPTKRERRVLERFRGDSDD